MNFNDLSFNNNSGELIVDEMPCPFITVESGKAQSISSLEAIRNQLTDCMALLDLLLCKQNDHPLVYRALSNSFVQKYRYSIQGLTKLNDTLVDDFIQLKSERYQRLHVLLLSQTNPYDELAVEKETMSLRLALKPMSLQEGLIGFYWLKRNVSTLDMKTILLARKLVKYILGVVKLDLKKEYQVIQKEYAESNLSALYQVAYQR